MELKALFLLGLVLGASQAIAGVEAELSGSEKAAVEIVPAVVVTEKKAATREGLLAYEPATSEVVPFTFPKEKRPLSLMLGVGHTSFVGLWGPHITNLYSASLGVDIPISRIFSVEGELNQGRYMVGYSNYKHPFEQVGLGINAKAYLMTGFVKPYVGAGFQGTGYLGMTRGPLAPQDFYDFWEGSGLLMAGVEVAVSEKVSLGVRGVYLRPLVNRPYAVNNGVTSVPGSEEFAAMQVAFTRLMAGVRVAL